MSKPEVAVGVLIFKNQKILLGKIKRGLEAGTWAPPVTEFGYQDSFEECAMREVEEATGALIRTPDYLAVTNDIFEDEEQHFVTIFMYSDFPDDQQIKNLQPERITGWDWFDLNRLPDNLFLPLQNLIDGDGLNLLLSITED
jgi:8-oxo-dGTP diphosphatase